jgi:Family of unknown function (DUF6230)
VKHTHGDLVQGRTRWRRFAVALVPAVAAAGAIVFGMANGAIAASFAVSGQTFKVSASRLEGTGFVQYGGFATEKGGTGAPGDAKTHAVAVSGMKTASLTDLCQSVKVPGLPLSLVIRAGGDGTPATAENLLIDMDQLQGNATFTNINIGQDASTLDRGPAGAVGLPGQFGQQADRVVITNLRQIARSTSAGTFVLNGLDLRVDADGSPEECF